MKYTLPISFIIAVLISFSKNSVSLFFRLSDIFFIVGFIHLLIGLILTVKNGALFKGIGFLLYKKNLKQQNQFNQEGNVKDASSVTMYDYLQDRHKINPNNKKYIIIGVTGFVVSQALVLLI